jgi:hypothetical protein
MTWQPFNTAPKIRGTRILAWCNAAESEPGIIEMIYRESVNSKTKEVIGYWDSVIDHPWKNACLNPKYWTESLTGKKSKHTVPYETPRGEVIVDIDVPFANRSSFTNPDGTKLVTIYSNRKMITNTEWENYRESHILIGTGGATLYYHG